MFQKVHLRLTFLCAGITAAIMIVMSVVYLYVSESGLYKNQFHAFKNDMNTITTHLEQQSLISMEWLSKMEAQGNYTFFLLDGDVPFLYNRLNGLTEHSGKQLLLEESLDAYHSMFRIETAPDAQPLSSPYVSYHEEFEFHSASAEKDYFCSLITMEKNSSPLQVIVLSSLDTLNAQILQQRIRFVFIDLAAILLLTIFSFIFTGKLLKPIQENQQKQVQFVVAASHELRTPLAVILSSAECCQNAPSDKQEGFLNTIRQEGLRMSALVDDMLTLSRSDSQRFSLQIQPVELDTLLISCYDSFDSLAKKKALSLSVNLPKDPIPACPCDSDRIRQILSILLHNAISYTPEGGRISLSLSYEKEHFYISVSDNGIGISDEDKKKIFDRFYRAEKARSAKEHFGLGLSIACEIVKAHHGTITVSDGPEGGSIFTLELPG